MVSQDKFYGGSEAATISANRTLNAGMKRIQVITPTTTGLSCVLGDSRDFKLGGPQFYIINLGPDSITLKNNGGSTLATINANQVCELYLQRNTGVNGNWFNKVSNVGFSDTVAANYYHYFAGGEYYTGQFVTVLNRTTEYNQVLDLYTQKTNSTLSGRGGAAFTYGTTIHNSGGDGSGTGHVQYDPDAWTSQTVMSASHENHGACELTANVGAVFGGSTSGGAGTYATRTRTDTFASGSWTSRTARPGVGGSNESPAVSMSSQAVLLSAYGSLETHVYSIDTWATKVSHPLPVLRGQAAFSDGTSGFLFAGSVNDISGKSVLGFKYSKAADVWTNVVSMPDPRTRPSGSYIAPYGMIFGGYTDSDFIRGTAYRYEPATDSLTRMTDINFWGWLDGQCHAQPCLR